jgi:hypothetical protein
MLPQGTTRAANVPVLELSGAELTAGHIQVGSSFLIKYPKLA